MQSLKRPEREWIIRYIPHAQQQPFHEERYKYKFRLISGGTGSGKTIAGVFEMLSYLLDDNPGAVGFIFEPTIPMVKRNLIKDAFETLLGAPLESNFVVRDFVKTDNRIDFTNGSRLWFGSLEDPEMAEGPNIDFIQVDEARLVRKFETAWRVVMRRIRGSKGDKYPTGAYVTTTPNAPGSYLHEFFEAPKTKHPNSHVYRMALFDNPHLTEEYKRDIEQSHNSPGLMARFIYGRFAAVGAATMPYDSTIHELDTIDKTVLKEVVYGVDFGWTNPSAIVAVGFDGDNRAYCLEEFYQKQVQIERLADVAKDMINRWGNGEFYCDSSEPRSIEILRRAGIRAYGNKTKCEDGIHKLAGRFKKAGDNRPRIYVHKSCRILIQELMVFNEERKEFDHAVDALRYAIMNKRGEIQVGRFDFWKTGRRER